MRCVIAGGAEIKDYKRISDYLNKDDFYIFCDCGLKHSEKLNITPNLIVGDFDSYDKPETDIETIVSPREKDDTDTVFAIKEGIKRGYDDFLLIGVIGERLDHTLVNVSILNYLDKEGKTGRIIDDYSEMVIINNNTAYVDDSFSYFSLINMFGVSEGVTIKNAKFPLDNADITCEYQYATSNEVLKGKTAQIKVNNGKLLLIKVK